MATENLIHKMLVPGGFALTVIGTGRYATHLVEPQHPLATSVRTYRYRCVLRLVLVLAVSVDNQLGWLHGPHQPCNVLRHDDPGNHHLRIPIFHGKHNTSRRLRQCIVDCANEEAELTSTPQPFYFSVAKPELSHLPAGVRWFPWTLPLVIFILITFVVVSRWNTWLPSIWLGWVLVLLGVALTTIYARTSPTGTWVSIAIVLGSGVGILYPSLHTASELIAEQEEEDNGKSRRAVTNYTFFQLLGKSFGVAIATSVFENEFFKHLRSNPLFERFAKEYTTDAVALVTRVRATTGGEGSPKTQIADAYVDSLKTIWILMAVLAGLALVVSCFMMPKESRKKQDVEMKNLDEGYVV